jgi:hypothetical protein
MLEANFKKLGWDSTTEAYYGLDFTPFMSVVEETIQEAELKAEYRILSKLTDNFSIKSTNKVYLQITKRMNEILFLIK